MLSFFFETEPIGTVILNLMFLLEVFLPALCLFLQLVHRLVPHLIVLLVECSEYDLFIIYTLHFEDMLAVVHALLDRVDPRVYGWEVQWCLLVWLREQEEADVREDTDALLPLRTEEALGEEFEVRRVVSVNEVG